MILLFETGIIVHIIQGVGLQLMVHIVHHVSNRHSIRSVRENAPALQLFVMQSLLQCKFFISLIQDMAMG